MPYHSPALIVSGDERLKLQSGPPHRKGPILYNANQVSIYLVHQEREVRVLEKCKILYIILALMHSEMRQYPHLFLKHDSCSRKAP